MDLLESLDAQYAGILEPISLPIAGFLHLPHLPPHFPTLVFGVALFQLTFVLSGIISPYLSRHYRSLPAKTKYQWKVKSVSQVNALLLSWLSITCYGVAALEKDKVGGWDPRVGRLCALACGFIWDTLETIFLDGNIGFILHGIACLSIFGFSFRPFIAYYAPRSLVWEVSTPFLNIHWWLDKTERTGTAFQLVNGILLLVTFFSVRLMYGGFITFEFLKTIYQARETYPGALLLTYVVGNLCLNVLNWIWFSKMIAALTKRFPGDKEKSA